jgi:bifunctional ADP-heptose synthase (sugar kinase/adenylyltransferase)
MSAVAKKTKARARRKHRVETPAERKAWHRFYGAADTVRSTLAALVAAGHDLDTVAEKALRLAISVEDHLDSIKPAETRYGRR